MTNVSLQRKSAARLVAVQCLYEQSVTGDASPPADLTTALKNQLSGKPDEQKLLVGQPVEPQYALVEKLLEGVRGHRGEIFARIDGVLSESWKRERMSPVLVAILECAVFEMFFYKEAKSAVIINEYTKLTRRFFGETEVGFVHAALKKLVEQYG